MEFFISNVICIPFGPLIIKFDAYKYMYIYVCIIIWVQISVYRIHSIRDYNTTQTSTYKLY